ncbi:Fic family protein, partial [Serratia aquatilis]
RCSPLIWSTKPRGSRLALCANDRQRRSRAIKGHSLVDAPGQLLSGNVGVYRDKQLIHMAPPANQLPRLVSDLLEWLQHTDIHPLIASSIFHYEFEFIHPFADGNGRMGRLWQTLILSEWRSELAWLPVETLIHNQQQEYYRVLGECDRASDCTPFIAFMLEKLVRALTEGIDEQRGYPIAMSVEMSVQMSVENPLPLSRTAERILAAVTDNPSMTIVQLAEQLKVSSRTIERTIKVLQQEKRLVRVGSTKSGYWQVV